MLIATKPNGSCPNCMRTKILLKIYHVKDYKIVKMNSDKLLKAGYRSYPVVMPNDKLVDKANWDGFNSLKIKKYAESLKK